MRRMTKISDNGKINICSDKIKETDTYFSAVNHHKGSGLRLIEWMKVDRHNRILTERNGLRKTNTNTQTHTSSQSSIRKEAVSSYNEIKGRKTEKTNENKHNQG